MKIRYGFVSNSSSSSFICDVSGEVRTIYSEEPNENGVCSCENGHDFLDEYFVGDIEEYVKTQTTKFAIERLAKDNYQKNGKRYTNRCSNSIRMRNNW